MSRKRRSKKSPRRPGRGADSAARSPRWVWIGVGLLVGAFAAWLWWPRSVSRMVSPTTSLSSPEVPEPDNITFARYAGSDSCRECHAREMEAWVGSNHGLAERLPTNSLDLAAFEPARVFSHGSQTTEVRRSTSGFEIVSTGLGGRREPQGVTRVIGHRPLRQYLVEAPDGRWQTMEASWDPRSNVWFNVYGAEDRQSGEWGHWTGRGMNWNAMCGTCHNTRYRKNYDDATDTYHTAMAERSVGCESCHGPMRDHVTWQRA